MPKLTCNFFFKRFCTFVIETWKTYQDTTVLFPLSFGRVDWQQNESSWCYVWNALTEQDVSILKASFTMTAFRKMSQSLITFSSGPIQICSPEDKCCLQRGVNQSLVDRCFKWTEFSITYCDRFFSRGATRHLATKSWLLKLLKLFHRRPHVLRSSHRFTAPTANIHNSFVFP